MVVVNKLVMASDGYLARPVGKWSKEKHHYLRRYCEIFDKGMQHLWPYRVYVDLFAGPGRCLIHDTGEEIDWSPIIAQRCSPPFTHFLFNDLDASATAALAQRTKALGTQQVEYMSLDCNLAIVPIVGRLRQLPSPPLCLCFIDPTGWQVTFNSVKTLTANYRMDLIVVFQSSSMKRAAHLSPDALTAFFDDDPRMPEWRTLYHTAPNGSRTRALVDHYEQRLKGIGYVWFHDHVSVELENDGLPLYQMLFASKHERGQDFWRKIAVKQENGQLRLGI